MNKNKMGMIFGSFVGDALALGPHWVYNTNVIDKKFGRVQQYFKPLVSYHKGKKKGDFTHYGDQMLLLLESLATASGFDQKGFAKAWQSFFNGYEGYRDKATLTTLQNMTEGNNILESGSSSDDLGGAARIAPIVYCYAHDLESAIQAARYQTALTHNNPSVLDSAEFFVRLAFSALAGKKPSVTIPELLENRFQNTDIAEAVSLGLASQDKDTRTIIAEFGQMCSVEAALPGTIHLITKYENDFKEALVENVMAGGDGAARGMLVGMVLGAYSGIKALPEEWLDNLNARNRIDDFLLAVDNNQL
ncbi:MAG: ADP-ribosylglycohydrolase family protein [Deltaproteobacteria bacterium]|nr:MAG: ADP-ribosylglycohydrolase family protein [Deltaproteobacteria bacterium]RLC11189.1 MAG: ADP-ribosylglycohydrolase family protein [Deltaproteobacteria bacterium]HHE74274.1 ADP-ribosylglycohydrolase family protein [Desulfobacteraceae bacterium]